MSNINDTYFDGYYKHIWKAIIPEEITPKETEFMLQYFGLQPDSTVLDLMCGYGRHALALAAKGMHVTAVDNLPDYINELKKKAAEEKLNINTALQDVLTYKPEGEFDLIICMGNSLQFFSKEELEPLLKKMAAHLKPGGSFLINTWSIMEIALKNFKDKSWSQLGGYKFLVDCRFCFSPNRIEAEHHIIAPDGSIEIKQSVDYIWSINEIEQMLADAGLQMKEVFSIPGRKKFTIGEPRAYIVAQKT